MSNEEQVTGRLPVYWWSVDGPVGTVSATINGVTEVLMLPTAAALGFGVTGSAVDLTALSLSAAYASAAGTIPAALATLLGTHTEATAPASWQVFDHSTDAWPAAVYRVTAGAGAASLTFSSADAAAHYGFVGVGPHNATLIDDGQVWWQAGDSAGYWTPARGLGQHDWREIPSLARYSLARYGSGDSRAQWGRVYARLVALHSDVQRARLWLSARLDPAYAVPAQTDPESPNNLFERLLDHMRIGQDNGAERVTYLRRVSLTSTTAPPEPLELVSDVQGELADGSGRSAADASQSEDVTLSWRWRNYPGGTP